MIAKEQYEALKPYEDNLFSSYNAGYCRNLGQQKVNVLDGLYVEIFGKPSQLRSGCSYCVLDSMKQLAKEFYAYESQVGKEPEPENVTNSISNNKPKRGRPKATNK